MGLSFLGSSSSYDSCKCAGGGGVTVSCKCASGGGEKRLPNPDPKNFEIERWKEIGNWFIVKIRYPDCTNYEGLKILVYQFAEIEGFILQGRKQGIDPHFAENKEWLSPFARFEPTEEGWEAAEIFVKRMERVLPSV